MRVQFVRSDHGAGYAVLILREDGVTVRLPGYDRTFRVPHDLAHLVAEREFRLARGVFGCIAAGAMFTNMSLVEGRTRYDARARSRAVLRANAAELGLAECLSGVVHDAVEYELEAGAAYRRLRESWGVLRPEPCPYRPADLRRAVDVLDELGRRWRTVGPGERLALRWTMPAGPVPVSRSDRRPATARRARAVASR
ncbi:MAG: hypothetical protein AUG44_18105 [Actinobacteria bacterium 13_1_20CM_3_71_11]|nr:MAG: hypothetical protein AUG44_18105 [Actinobacteria bacterium 13_1_20CM_3_71_11]